MDHDEEVLIAAIRQEPEDNLARLALADWLEEQKKPDKAEFIRVQVQLATGATLGGTPLSPDAREGLMQRADELWVANRGDWEGPLERLGVTQVEFDRGLPAAVFIPAARFLDHAEELFRHAPSITSLHLRGRVTGHQAAALAACPQIGRLNELWIECDPRLRDRRTATVVASPHLGGLRQLHIRGQGAGIETARALASSPHLASLRTLDLTGNDLSDAGAEAISGSSSLRGLRTLGLFNNDISDIGALALARSQHLSGLEVLDAGGNAIGDQGARALARSDTLGRLGGLGLDQNRLSAGTQQWVRRVVAERGSGRVPQR